MGQFCNKILPTSFFISQGSFYFSDRERILSLTFSCSLGNSIFELRAESICRIVDEIDCEIFSASIFQYATLFLS